jgi:hypothetical protein
MVIRSMAWLSCPCEASDPVTVSVYARVRGLSLTVRHPAAGRQMPGVARLLRQHGNRLCGWSARNEAG